MTVQELIEGMYPDTFHREGEYCYGTACDYQPMLDTMGQILVQHDDDSYQGDSFLLLKRGRQIGYLQFGWGSCSGCDALQACESAEDALDLYLKLQSEIKWFESPAKAMGFFVEHDWEGDYGWYGGGSLQEFVPKAMAELEKLSRGYVR